MNNHKRTSVGAKTFYNFDGFNVELINHDGLISFTKRDKDGKVTASFQIDKTILKVLILEGLVLIQNKYEKE